jgi:hypothetical protein
MPAHGLPGLTEKYQIKREHVRGDVAAAVQYQLQICFREANRRSQCKIEQRGSLETFVAPLRKIQLEYCTLA